MKVLFITHGFPPAQHSGVFRSEAFAKYLPDFGIEPVVVAATDAQRVPPYPNRQSEEEDSRRGPVYRTDWRIETPASEWPALYRFLRRVPVGVTGVKHILRQRVMERVLPLVRQAIAEHSPSVIYASSPPEEALMIAVRAGQEHGLPVVCDIRDLWSYGFEKRYRHLVDFWFERRLERQCLSKAVRVIANTPTARDLMVSQLSLDSERVTLLPNGYDEHAFADIATTPEIEAGKFTVVYTGLLARPGSPSNARWAVKRILGIDYNPMCAGNDTRSPRYVLEAVGSLLDRKPEWRSVLRVRFIGSYLKEEVECARTFRYPECVSIDPPVSRREALSLCCRANLLLLLQIEMKLREDGRDSSTAVPAKLFDYVRSGTRILAPLQESDAADLVRRFDAGVIVPPRDVAAIANALENELVRWRNGGTNHRAAPSPELQLYERHALTEKLADILRHAAKEKGIKCPLS